MKTNLSLKALIVSSCCLLLAGFATARRVPTWPYEKLTAEAALIVIATPTAVRETEERTTLMATMPTIGVETTFGISSILKGQADTKTIVLHHLRLHLNDGEIPIPDGPGLVSFDPKEKKSFLLFLKREADGRYASLNGQIDPDFGVKLLEYPPFAVVEKRNRTARLQFRLDRNDKGDDTELLNRGVGSDPLRVSRDVLLDETAVGSAWVLELGSARCISLRFTDAGGKKFAQLTGAHLGRHLAIVFDGKLISESIITAATTDGSVLITINHALNEAEGFGEVEALAKEINAAIQSAAAKLKPDASDGR